mmetsp:Transcript_32753/g.105820  ORF Transcript_32753/g.105820 Transcript_32753/m.105820 type:complete len:425 (-) Transcript_32753:215-1489(-)|eukprot:scaffold5558_cov131-Isochrysis_galbana.AAC.2
MTVARAENPDVAAVTLPTPSLTLDGVFEGPEKKLEVFFRPNGSHAAGFRLFGTDEWSELLSAAACTILNKKSNSDFDAYLLSESSLFVFPFRIVVKTCGTTTLLLTVPRLLNMAEALGASMEVLQYGHLRYKFPHMQMFPSRSHDEERAYLASMFGDVQSLTVGPADGCCWLMLSVESPAPEVQAVVAARAGGSEIAPIEPSAQVAAAPQVDGTLEIAMEGLSAEVCALFGFERGPDGKDVAGWGPLPDGALARAMTSSCGLSDLLAGVQIDDWAFEPCGYSMNGLAGPYYYTVHVTPESAFSYASFETNDPKFRAPQLVERVIGCFSPSDVTITLTTRGKHCELPSYTLADLERTALGEPTLEVRPLGAASICYAGFRARDKDSGLPLCLRYPDGPFPAHCGEDGFAFALGEMPTPTASPEEA